MKKHRKQMVDVGGQKQLVDVPVDDELYKADRRSEYQRVRSKKKDVSLDEIVFADLSADITEEYEEKQLLENLRKAMQLLTAEERQLIEYIYYAELTERKIAEILGISQPAVTRRKHKIIEKLRNSLRDWM